jgi:hypothetical protein
MLAWSTKIGNVVLMFALDIIIIIIVGIYYSLNFENGCLRWLKQPV